jgi:hypothetical protein
MLKQKAPEMNLGRFSSLRNNSIQALNPLRIIPSLTPVTLCNYLHCYHEFGYVRQAVLR